MDLKITGAIVVLLVVGGWLTLSQSSDFTTSNAGSVQPCGEPLTYRFGDIDSRFNITEKELADIMKKVEELWATALDKDLLDYQKEGKVTIHLIYSENQKRTEAERIFARRIESSQHEIETRKREYNLAVKRYQKRKKDFQFALNEYNNAVENYNVFAQKWSGKNVPAEVKNKIKRMKQEINRLKIALDREQRNLEVQRRKTNGKSQQLNQLIERQNRMVTEYNSKYTDSKKFDQGRYVKQGNSEQIKIFQFANHAQLKTVLAHEAGHAMGLSHVDNPESVMHEMMGKQNIFNLELTEEDIAAINNRCRNEL